MKKLIFIIPIIALCLSAKAQKLEKPAIDKFTGDTSLSTSEVTITNKFSLLVDYLSCSAHKYGGNAGYSLCFHIMKAVDYFTVHSGDKCYIKFADGKIITLFANEESIAESKYSSMGSYADGYAWFSLKNDDIEAINNGVITNLRITTSIAPFDYDIKPKSSDAIKKEIALIGGI